jgi:hypothetical protein
MTCPSAPKGSEGRRTCNPPVTPSTPHDETTKKPSPQIELLDLPELLFGAERACRFRLPAPGSPSQRRNLACGSVISKHILTEADRISPHCGPGPASTRSMNDKELAPSRIETEAHGKRVARLIAESQKLVATCWGLQQSIQPGRRSRNSSLRLASHDFQSVEVPTIKPDHTGCLHLHLK